MMMANGHENFKGMKIKCYDFLQMIGAGNFACVWEAYSQRDRKTVAVKAIPLSKLINDKIKQLVSSEIAIMKALTGNPNIVHFIDNFRCSQSILIVMEYCPSGTLEQQLIEEDRFSEEKAIYYLKQMINGFRGLHGKNVIHRDFKSANVLVKQGIAKIADFGFAKMLTAPNSITGTILGTSLTMAPEVHEGRPYGMKADIWSLGVVFFGMIYGRYPFYAETESLLCEALMKRPSFEGVHISPKTKDFILKCLTVDDTDRISWAQLYKHPLIAQNQSALFGVTMRNTLNKNIDFYNSPQDFKAGELPANLVILDKLQQVQTQQLKKEDQEKARLENQAKKKIKTEIGKYQNLYLNKCNNIMFVFRHIIPNLSFIVGKPGNIAGYTFLLCKKAFHEMERYSRQLLKQENFLGLKPFFKEFVESQTYRDLYDMVNDEVFIIGVQAQQFQKRIKDPDGNLKSELVLEIIASKDWQAYIEDIAYQFECLLMPELDRVKQEDKKSLILGIEALSHLRFIREDTIYEIVDQKMKDVNFFTAEKDIRRREQDLLKRFQQ